MMYHYRVSTQGLLGCEAMLCCGRIQIFQSSMLPPSSPWIWRQHGTMKCWYPTTTPHGVTSHNTLMWNVITVKASKSALLNCPASFKSHFLIGWGEPAVSTTFLSPVFSVSSYCSKSMTAVLLTLGAFWIVQKPKSPGYVNKKEYSSWLPRLLPHSICQFGRTIIQNEAVCWSDW
jgi:hypothetical protein